LALSPPRSRELFFTEYAAGGDRRGEAGAGERGIRGIRGIRNTEGQRAFRKRAAPGNTTNNKQGSRGAGPIRARGRSLCSIGRSLCSIERPLCGTSRHPGQSTQSKSARPPKTRTRTRDVALKTQNLPNTDEDEDIRTRAARKYDKVQQNTDTYTYIYQWGDRTRIRGNKQVCPPSCDEPHGEATASRSPSSSTAAHWLCRRGRSVRAMRRLPRIYQTGFGFEIRKNNRVAQIHSFGSLQLSTDESRYGENRGKKKRLSEEKAVGEMFWTRIPCGGGAVRA
jgi:hypothetical protein